MNILLLVPLDAAVLSYARVVVGRVKGVRYSGLGRHVYSA